MNSQPIYPILSWTSMENINESVIDKPILNWLLDDGSLTSKLIELSKNQFGLELLDQTQRAPLDIELSVFDVKTIGNVIDRKVVLMGNTAPWVYAQSIIPLSTAVGDLAILKNLNKRSLGEFIFKNKAIKRRSLQIACLSASEYGIPIRLCGADRMLWGRRSLFTLNTNSLLVSEIFLPSLILKINS